ncbi:MAG: hypothetical protein HEQ39_17460 [Rhizobacter sp.]
MNLIVSLVDLPEPTQMVVNLKSGSSGLFELNSLHSATKVQLEESYKIKIELIDEKGGRRDITDSKYLKFNTSKPYAFHVADRRLIIKPEPGTIKEAKNIGSGLGQVRVEFVSPNGQIGFNGFVIDVQENK